ncbi:hypothetical protein ACFQZV_05990 [Microbacterium koreense]|uniref:Leucyl-tRNA synthetase n=1 Tax=Microbacterium koreense TaxID=323761 RepID=A0ABW2ZQF0_9MICO
MSRTAIDALLEIFTWVGIGAGIVVALIAVIAKLADGVWVASHLEIVEDDRGHTARWFSDAGLGEARLTDEQVAHLGGADAAEGWVRRGYTDRVRFTRRSPSVRFVAWLAVGLLSVGVLCAAASLVLLFVR